MEKYSTLEILYGRNTPPPEQIKLKTGNLELIFQDGDLRYIQLEGVELIRRVYMAVRDVNWNTIPGVMTDLVIHSNEDNFSVSYVSTHQTSNLAFSWQASIIGAREGKIECILDGMANIDFRYCRIGFCVLHPIRECAGRPFQAKTQEGLISGSLPILVGPQLIEGEFETPLFPAFSDLSINMDDGLNIHTNFEGDLFEIEDQRNWTDGSFKTYSTPISLGYPHDIRAGQKIQQKVTIWADSIAQKRARESAFFQQRDSLTLGNSLKKKLPKIGFGLSNEDSPLSSPEIDYLNLLKPDHLKVEIHFKNPGWKHDLERAVATAKSLLTSLEIAAFVDDEPALQFENLKSELTGASISRFLVFNEAEAPKKATSEKWMEMAKNILGKSFTGIPIFGGTNGNFAEINRDRATILSMQGLSYTINPQVHSHDEASLIEALEAQGDTVVTARSFAGNLPVIVSSVTLRPPFNQAATQVEISPPTSELPDSVDARQMSLFGAVWTLGSIKYLAEAGIDSVTYYETIGWRGLIENQKGSLLPIRFPSHAGMIFPLYYIFAYLTEYKQAEIYECKSGDPLAVAGLLLRAGCKAQLLVANLKTFSQQITIAPLPKSNFKIQYLDQDTAEQALFDPYNFRSSFKTCEILTNELVINVKPYAVIAILWEE
jgi:D-apionolactonase